MNRKPEQRRSSPRARWAAIAERLLLAAFVATAGCQKTYYTVLEKVGIEKRELLERRVERAKDSQEEAQEQFKDALEKFQAVTGHRGGDLEERYDDVREAYDRSAAQAREVSERIDAVEDVAEDLMREWESELERYEDASLRRRSAERLRQTRSDVERLLASMRRAEAHLEPVLEKLEDRVLYLKHNLNAAALSGLESGLPELERDIERLVRDMQTSIAEADRFIAEIE